MTTTGKNGKKVNASKGVQGFHEVERTAGEVYDGVLGAPDASSVTDEDLALKIGTGDALPTYDTFSDPAFGAESAKMTYSRLRIKVGDEALSLDDEYVADALSDHTISPPEVLSALASWEAVPDQIRKRAARRLVAFEVDSAADAAQVTLDATRDRLRKCLDEDKEVPSSLMGYLMYEQATRDLWRQVGQKATEDDIEVADALAQVSEEQQTRLIHGMTHIGHRQLLSSGDATKKQAEAEASVDFIRASKRVLKHTVL
ncbi:hypothetical protein [Aeromicrobium sp. 179-A 4D2 NHS]|uniref:hypothetical protein n=1 Tax=Aeromicrobium sp. 179-A 4D2 NHS TaxID=3142375 RepID=UPI0039A0B815